MLSIENIIGDIIYISFKDADRMREIGIKDSSGHYMLKGYDKMGLWLKHHGIIIQHLEDEKGRPLLPDRQYNEEIDAVFLVTWDNINTMMHYPNRKGFDYPDQYNKKIGFRFKNQEIREDID